MHSTAEGLHEWFGFSFGAPWATAGAGRNTRCTVSYAGKDSLDKDPSFLSIEQALADYAALIYHLKEKFRAEGCPVIAFGGSYGGMLAAWLRAKYPNAIQVTHTIPGFTNCLLKWASMLGWKCHLLTGSSTVLVVSAYHYGCSEVMALLVMQGSIAASAPVRAFASRLNPSFNPSAFWEVRTSRCKGIRQTSRDGLSRHSI